MKRKISVKRSWLISYISIAAISILICSISLSFFQNKFKNLFVESQKNIVYQVVHKIDTDLNALNQCSQSIIESGIIDDSYSFEDKSLPLFIQNKSTVKKLNKLTAVSGTVDKYYIYFPEEDMILSQSSMVDSKTIFKTHHNASSLTYNEWKNILCKKNHSDYYVDNILSSYGKPLPYIFFKKDAVTNQGKPYCVILMSRLSNSMHNKNNYVSTDNLTIFEDNDKIIYNSGILNTKDFKLSGNKSVYKDRKSGEKYIVINADSSYINWDYVFFTPYTFYYTPLNNLKAVIIIVLVLALILSIAFSYYLTTKNYKPVKNLVSIFEKENKSSNNDFTYISENIKGLIENNTHLKMSNENMTQNSVLKSLLAGNIPYNMYVKNLLAERKIILSEKFIYVAFVRIDDFSELFPEGSYKKGKFPIETVFFLIVNVAKDILMPVYQTYYCSIDEGVYFIINSENEASSEIEELLKEIKSKLRNLIYISTSIALSDKTNNATHLNIACSQCRHVLDYQWMFSDDNTISYENIKNLSINYNYTASDETKIINAISNGDIDTANKYIESIFEDNLKNNLSVPGATMLIYNIMTSFFKICETINNQELHERIRESLSDEFTIETALTEINNIISLLCAYYNDSKSKYAFSDSIVDLIKNNYQDLNFSVSEISYSLGKSRQYISKIFKQETGENLSTYIQKYRIDVSKELLLNTNLTIKEIALDVGFANSNSYIYNFKNIEGITPSQFKASHRE